jgi:hypothetical protein
MTQASIAVVGLIVALVATKWENWPVRHFRQKQDFAAAGLAATARQKSTSRIIWQLLGWSLAGPLEDYPGHSALTTTALTCRANKDGRGLVSQAGKVPALASMVAGPRRRGTD